MHLDPTPTRPRELAGTRTDDHECEDIAPATQPPSRALARGQVAQLPHLAEHGQPVPGHRQLREGVERGIEVGLALYESFSTVKPSGDVASSMRQAAVAAPARLTTTAPSGTPRCRATVAAMAVSRPGAATAPQPDGGLHSGRVEPERGPELVVEPTSEVRTSAPALEPTVTTGAGCGTGGTGHCRSRH